MDVNVQMIYWMWRSDCRADAVRAAPCLFRRRLRWLWAGCCVPIRCAGLVGCATNQRWPIHVSDVSARTRARIDRTDRVACVCQTHSSSRACRTTRLGGLNAGTRQRTASPACGRSNTQCFVTMSFWTRSASSARTQRVYRSIRFHRSYTR